MCPRVRHMIFLTYVTYVLHTRCAYEEERHLEILDRMELLGIVIGTRTHSAILKCPEYAARDNSKVPQVFWTMVSKKIQELYEH
jgi:hypothetical protein